MKTVSRKILPLGLILVALGITYYLYRKGEISLWTKEKKVVTRNNFPVQVPIIEREFKLSYGPKAIATFDIANFEEGENWYGDGEFDYTTFLEGKSSLFLTSLDNKKVSTTLKKSFDLKDVLNFKFLVYLTTEPVNIEEFNLIFTGQNESYKFPIRDIRSGWNLLVLPQENFSKAINEVTPPTASESKIKQVIIELVSRTKARSTVNLDSLWAEKESDYLKDWNANGEKFLSIKRIGDQGKLLLVGSEGTRATLARGSAKDYTFWAEFIPLRAGRFGLFLRADYKSGYGYYLTMDGADTDSWRIYKFGLFEGKEQELDLHKGTISNFKMEKNQPYWLQAKLKEAKINFSFSLDGKNFVELGETTDDSFKSGGLGVVVSGGTLVLVDNFEFTQ